VFSFKPQHLRRICWLALSAMLALALLPAVSRAMAAATGQASWAEVCTPLGVRAVALAEADSGVDNPPSGSAGASLEHCPYCASSALSLGMPPAALSVDRLLAQGAELPALFLQATHTLHAWRSAQPRAPPFLS
jgi:Protein of unknown function (DUF2946)